MDKEEQQRPLDDENHNNSEDKKTDENIVENNLNADQKKEKKEITPEERIKELEDKLARTFAEMENQRRRFEKEKEDAFEYGGTSFAKEALNLIDNLERSKQVLENDEKSKNTEKENKGSKFFSYLIVFIISFVAFIILLDTLKNPLIDVFPGLEIILFNLFETLQDIKLFIIDLI